MFIVWKITQSIVDQDTFVCYFLNYTIKPYSIFRLMFLVVLFYMGDFNLEGREAYNVIWGFWILIPLHHLLANQKF
jgi:hypothetical protein